MDKNKWRKYDRTLERKIRETWGNRHKITHDKRNLRHYGFKWKDFRKLWIQPQQDQVIFPLLQPTNYQKFLQACWCSQALHLNSGGGDVMFIAISSPQTAHQWLGTEKHFTSSLKKELVERKNLAKSQKFKSKSKHRTHNMLEPWYSKEWTMKRARNKQIIKDRRKSIQAIRK